MNNHSRFIVPTALVIMFLASGTQGQPRPKNAPLLPLEGSELVVKTRDGALVVAKKDGSGIDGIKLSQYDTLISPAIVVAPDGTIHVAFLEQHRTTQAKAIYHRSSSDGGKTWSEAKNLSERSSTAPRLA